MQKRSRKTTPWFFYLIMALLPLFFFAGLELSLRLGDYGTDLRQWVAKGDKYTLNPDIGLRYFSHVKHLPSTIEDIFDIEKKENAYRVFVLGGSSAAGFPFMPMGSFSRYLRKRLEMNYPDKTIEVVNIAITAVNSYTVLDLLPGVLEQKPDVILIYMGHNEYYGALGVGSLESFGRSRQLVTARLYLNRFRTIQLLDNLLARFAGWAGGKEGTGSPSGSHTTHTLMSTMAEEKAITYASPLFYQGVQQFETNLSAVIEACRQAGVPLLIGTLTSNIKDQAPFKSVAAAPYPPAQDVFEKACAALADNDTAAAAALFTRAKDLDALRFRAPTEMNEVIVSLAKAYHVPIVDVAAAFRDASPDHLVGDELIVDHLHPTLEGYQLMGKTYYEGLHDKGLLPEGVPVYPYEKQHDLTVANFVITDLDKKIAEFTILKLKNDWPFVGLDQKKYLKDLVQAGTLLDALSLEVADNRKKWQVAHAEMARNALAENDLKTFLRHMDVLIYQYPATAEIYDLVVDELLKRGQLSGALPYLKKRYKPGTSAYISKWIGIAFLSQGQKKDAVPYLEESVRLGPHDPQTFYNLCAGYIYEGRYAEAKEALQTCLQIAPDFPGAKSLLEQMIRKGI